MFIKVSRDGFNVIENEPLKTLHDDGDRSIVIKAVYCAFFRNWNNCSRFQAGRDDGL